ncbi:acyl carrier protein [Streptomyces sp. DSM 3412]|uniref:Acyl carrier protein n=1 Tax=Streptomyces gottesmaniae TaxID=3075518 RepID=A0ABU2YS79_9ACTN|nr:acyl carrier protein [Streptomyces sp. DSM 3412]MDT0566718.1 acyl carrier protein [Streptomyces sp. DSM 3412]
MSSEVKTFDVGDLRRILREGAGADENVDLEGNILDLDFEDLGYDSLARLETGGRIEREFRIKLADETLTEVATPRALIEAVNAQLRSTPTG